MANNFKQYNIVKTPMLPIKTTVLEPELNNLYQQWVSNNHIPESKDYDMKGFFLDLVMDPQAAQTSINSSDGQLHFTDKWKLPNHPSFSNESIYSKSNQDPYWTDNVPPYKDGTWALRDKIGNKVLEIPK